MTTSRTLTLLALSLFLFSPLFSQKQVARIEPPNWWVGMHQPQVQLLIYGKNVAELNPSVDYAGVRIERVIKVKNPNYLFVDLFIGKDAQPGDVRLHFSKNARVTESHTWQLLAREPGAAQRAGFDNSDVLYLITPDRFANGDPSNDAVAGMREKPNRAFKGGRHGGDIEGVRKHLDYIKGMGFTAIWLNPLLENDMAEYSYHGYSTTDFYKVDPRFGTNDAYRQLALDANSMGIKLIMDMIVNHCGSEHWWMKDLPCDDWLNTWPSYTETNHRKSLIQDPYAAAIDHKVFTDGWFVPTMPDLNQRNTLLATYLTQNSIWWVEYLGLAGIRMDTYPYPDMHYMTEWTRRLMQEYPRLNIVGEEWYETPTIVAYWQKGKINPNGYTSDLKSLMDFPLQAALSKALTAPESWGDGWIRLYEMLAQDFVYADPQNLVVFPDNHDMSRIFTQVNEDFGLFKLALAYILTTRGIPQLYYGTEILMKNPGTNDHGIIRSDFPGGWAGDSISAFTGQGLSDQQKEAQAFLAKLLHWRQKATAVHHGKLTHFLPQNGVYVFFRYDERQKLMVVLNKNAGPMALQLDRFAELLNGLSTGTDVISGKTFNLQHPISLTAKEPLILELK